MIKKIHTTFVIFPINAMSTNAYKQVHFGQKQKKNNQYNATNNVFMHHIDYFLVYTTLQTNNILPKLFTFLFS